MPLALLTGTATGMAQLTVTLFAIKIGADHSQIGMIRGMESIGMMVTILIAGMVVDNFGARRSYIIGGLMGALFYPFVPMMRSPYALFGMVALLGLFMPFRFVAMNSTFLNNLNAIGQTKSGWYRASHSLGMVFLGPLLGGFINQAFDYQHTFWLICAVFASGGLLAKIILQGRLEAAAAEEFSLKETLNRVKQMFSQRPFTKAVIYDTLSTATVSCFNTFIIVIAIEIFHLDEKTAAGFIALYGSAFIGSLFLFGGLLKTIGQKIIYPSGILMTITALVLLGVNSIPCLWTGAVLLGIGVGLIGIITIHAMSNVKGSKGKVAAISGMFFFTGSAIGPMFGGIISSALGPQAVFWAFIPIFLALVLGKYFFSLRTQ